MADNDIRDETPAAGPLIAAAGAVGLLTLALAGLAIGMVIVR